MKLTILWDELDMLSDRFIFKMLNIILKSREKGGVTLLLCYRLLGLTLLLCYRLLGLTALVYTDCSKPVEIFWYDTSKWQNFINPGFLLCLYYNLAVEIRRNCGEKVKGHIRGHVKKVKRSNISRL